MIAECARVLAPGGILALTVPNQSLRFGERYQRFWCWVWSLPQWVKNLLLDSQLAATQGLQEAQECVEKTQSSDVTRSDLLWSSPQSHRPRFGEADRYG